MNEEEILQARLDSLNSALEPYSRDGVVYRGGIVPGIFRELVRGVSNFVGDFVEGIPDLSAGAALGPAGLAAASLGVPLVSDRFREPFDRVGGAISDFAEGIPTIGEVEGRHLSGVESFFREDVPRGLGSTLPFFAAGAAGGAAGLSRTAITGIEAALGIAAGGGEARRRVEEADAEGIGAAARVAAGQALGALDIVAPLEWLGRIGRRTNGAPQRFLRNLFETAGEEGVTEFIQELGGSGADFVALGEDVRFDEAFSNAARAGAAGFIVGGAFGAVGNRRSPNAERDRILKAVHTAGFSFNLPEGFSLEDVARIAEESGVETPIASRAAEKIRMERERERQQRRVEQSEQQSERRLVRRSEGAENIPLIEPESAAEGGPEQRGFAEQIEADESLVSPVRDNAQQMNYLPITNVESVEEAQRFIAEHPGGLQGAITETLDFSKRIAPRIRITVAGQLIRNLNELAIAGGPDGQQAYVNQTIQIANSIAEFGTTLGQGIQAFAIFQYLTPQAWLNKFRATQSKSAQRGFEDDRVLHEEIYETVNNARVAAIENSLSSEGVRSLLGTVKMPESLREKITIATNMGNALSVGDLTTIHSQLEKLGVNKDIIGEAASELQKQYQANIEEALTRSFERSYKSIKEAAINTAAQGLNPSSHLKDLIRHVRNGIKESGDNSRANVEALIRDFYDSQVAPFTKEQEDTIVEKATKMQQLPEGFLKADAAADLLSYMTRQIGVGSQGLDILFAYWYANIFSGVGTHEVNVVATAWNVMTHAMEMALALPGSTPAMLRGMAAGAKVGLKEFRAAIRGESTPKAAAKLQLPGTLEAFYNHEKPWWAPDNIWTVGRFVGRLLRAPDAFWYRTAYEGAAYALAHDYAKKALVGANRRTYNNYAAQILFNTETDSAAAEHRARKELDFAGRLYDKNGGLNRRDLDRRIYEIMLENRSGERGGRQREREAVRFAERATFTIAPEGFMGGVASGVSRMISATAIKTPYGDFRLLTPIVPVVNIVANVADRLVDFAPVIGPARAALGRRISGAKTQRFSEAERKGRVRLGIISTILTPLLYAMATDMGEENEEKNNGFIFDMTGSGPQDFARRAQWREQGNLPWSIRIKTPGGGSTYVRYNEAPFAMPFMIVGAIRDAKKYGGFEEEDMASVVSFSTHAVFSAFLDMSFVRGVADLFAVIEGEKKLTNFSSGPLSGFVPFSSLMRDLANMTDPQMRDPASISFLGRILRDVPILRGYQGKEAVNALGQPIKKNDLQRNPLTRRFFNRSTDDEVWLWLAKNKLFVPDPRRSGDVSITTSSPTKAEQALESYQINKRRVKLGNIAAGVLTEDELYDFVKFRGELLRGTIQQGIKDGAFDRLLEEAENEAIKQNYRPGEARLLAHKALQRAINRLGTEASDRAKRQLLGIPIEGIRTPGSLNVSLRGLNLDLGI